MATLKIDWATGANPYRDIDLWHRNVENSRHQRTVGTRDEWIGRCLYHQPDSNPSLVYSYDPHDATHPILFYCRAGCGHEDIVRSLLEREAAVVAALEAEESMPNQTPPFIQDTSTEQGEPSFYESTQAPIFTLAGYCGVSPGWLREHPVLALGEDVPGQWVLFKFDGAPGKKSGPVGKARRMPPSDHGKEKDIQWYNSRKPIPPFWPIPPQELPEEIALCEGETDTILARWWGFEAYSLTAGGGDLPEASAIQELARRGAKSVLIFYDDDTTGHKCRDGLVRLCQDATLRPVPVDLRLLCDPFLGGHKDLRDYRHLFPGEEGREEAHRAIREVIARSEALLDEVIPNFEEAFARRTPDPGWLMDNFLASGCISMLVAKPGLGKTTILMALARDARAGGTLLGLDVHPQRVLFVTEEGTRSLWKKRETFGDMSHVRLHSVDFEGFDDVDWAEQVRIMADVARRHRCDTIIIDTLFSFAAPEDEDKSAKVRPVFKQLRALTRQGFAVLTTMHGRKAAGSGVDVIAGSIAIPGEADIALEIAPAEDGEHTHRKVTWIKNRMNPDVLGRPPLTITAENDQIIVLDDGTGEVERGRRLMALLGDHSWRTGEECASALSCTLEQVQPHLDRLVRNRTVVREVGQGRGRNRQPDRFRLEQPIDLSHVRAR